MEQQEKTKQSKESEHAENPNCKRLWETAQWSAQWLWIWLSSHNTHSHSIIEIQDLHHSRLWCFCVEMHLIPIQFTTLALVSKMSHLFTCFMVCSCHPHPLLLKEIWPFPVLVLILLFHNHSCHYQLNEKCNSMCFPLFCIPKNGCLDHPITFWTDKLFILTDWRTDMKSVICTSVRRSQQTGTFGLTISTHLALLKGQIDHDEDEMGVKIRTSWLLN